MDDAMKAQINALLGESLSPLEVALGNLYNGDEDLWMASRHLLDTSLCWKPIETIGQLVCVMTSEESLSFRLNVAKFLTSHVMFWPSLHITVQGKYRRDLLNQFLAEKDESIEDELIIFFTNLTIWILCPELLSQLHSYFTNKASEETEKLQFLQCKMKVLRLLESLHVIPSLELSTAVAFAYSLYESGLEDEFTSIRLASFSSALKFMRMSRSYKL